ncbi:MAG: hypothetical protein NVSMB39_7400 [Candidatus Saccharimonadales bacterium]
MARKSHDDAFGVAGAETIIGAGVVIHGDLLSEADIIIDGTVEGTISSHGDLSIGVNARIKANVTAGNITVSGRLNGNITATGEAVIRETGQVEGDITSSGLSIIPGGVFVGSSHMKIIEGLGEIPSDKALTEKKPRKI